MHFIEENHIVTPNLSRIVLAVSGGADSMALAYLMQTCYPRYHYVIAHVNHGLREEAAMDEALVRDFAQRMKAEFCLYRCNVAFLAKERGKGIEETGREERYRFFRSLAADLILTAHHKDDHGETVLMHLIRGSGLQGLCGLSPLDRDIGRPLLCVTKEEIYAYCKEHQIPYREDLSNGDTVYTRNKVRKELIPLMKEINPNLIDALYRLSLSLADDEKYLDRLALQSYKEAVTRSDGGLALTLIPSFFDEPALSRRWIRLAAAEWGVSLSFERTEAIRSLGEGKRLPLTSGLWVSRSDRRLLFGAVMENEARLFEPLVIGLGKTVSKDGSLAVTAANRRAGSKGDVCNHGFFSEELFLREPPVLRTRLPGDYIVLSQGGRKKLSDYFIDEKVPLAERDTRLLLAVGSRVLWLIGRRFFVSPGKCNLELLLEKKIE